jgi:hypothetical protein
VPDGRPTVFVHVGEPKSGTTFVQQVMWANRDALARQGVLLPGLHPQDHFRANQDLRQVPQAADDPTGSYAGEWDLLAKQALQAERAAVISHELLAAATEEQAARGIASLDGADVHIVLSLRDFVSLLPAEWQETVKHRNRQTWQQWLRRVRATDPEGKPERIRWFWRVHDTPDVLRRWTPGIPADHVHVVTLPPPGSPPNLLWERFASVLGVDPAGADLTSARPNTSLGMAEAEMLRRLNVALGKDGADGVGAYFYGVHVKERLGHEYLAHRTGGPRPQLPPAFYEWAAQRCELVIDTLHRSGYHIVGSLDDLRPRPGYAAPRRTALSEPPVEDVLDAAIGALATTLRQQYAAPHGEGSDHRVVDLPAAKVPVNPRVKRLVRDLSSRYPAVGRARVLAWRLTERARSRRSR